MLDAAVLDADSPERVEPASITFNLTEPSADTALMGTERLAPIYSACLEDPSLSEAIDAFVVGLGEWLDGLQDAEVAGDLARVGEIAEKQAREALRVGYPRLAESASEVANTASAGESEAARKAIGDLIELVQRIRLGHRTAA